MVLEERVQYFDCRVIKFFAELSYSDAAEKILYEPLSRVSGQSEVDGLGFWAAAQKRVLGSM